jgi:predicted nucleic acid-binding protein
VKTTADTSVLVAAFASWHEHHTTAREAIERLDVVVAHCLLETYSVLTRLPAPHRIAPDDASTYLEMALGKHPIASLSAAEQRTLVSTCAERGIAGGSIYDALIAATCVDAKLSLLTLDTRARQTYALIGADHTVLG